MTARSEALQPAGDEFTISRTFKQLAAYLAKP
jgi:hypothetical protein